MPPGVADSSPRLGRRAGSSLAHLSFVSTWGVPRSGGARRGVRFGAPPTAAGEVNQRRDAGLRRILADADATELSILDWFHIGMRLQHLKQIAAALSADHPARVATKAMIVAEVERLPWRIWNGKTKNVRKSIDRIRAVMSHFQGEAGGRTSIAPSRKLWAALHAVDGYLSSQSAWLVNYAERHRAGLRVGTALTEGTANFLVNRRMNKAQQMRWSRRGADLLLQVRCAVYNGTLGSGFGQRFRPANDPYPPIAMVACLQNLRQCQADRSRYIYSRRLWQLSTGAVPT